MKLTTGALTVCPSLSRDTFTFYKHNVTEHIAPYPVFYIASNKYSVLLYLLTPWRRDLLEKLTGSAASQEIPRILSNPKVLLRDTSSRNTPPPRSECGSSFTSGLFCL